MTSSNRMTTANFFLFATGSLLAVNVTLFMLGQTQHPTETTIARLDLRFAEIGSEDNGGVGELEGFVGEDFKFCLQLRNHGAEPVRIVKTEASCSCTEVHLQQEVVAPKSFAAISGTVKSPSTPGTVHVNLRAECAGEETGALGIAEQVISVIFKSSIEVGPCEWDHDSGGGVDELPQRFLVTNLSDSPLQIKVESFLNSNLQFAPNAFNVAPGESKPIRLRSAQDGDASRDFLRLRINGMGETILVPVDSVNE